MGGRRCSTGGRPLVLVPSSRTEAAGLNTKLAAGTCTRPAGRAQAGCETWPATILCAAKQVDAAELCLSSGSAGERMSVDGGRTHGPGKYMCQALGLKPASRSENPHIAAPCSSPDSRPSPVYSTQPLIERLGGGLPGSSMGEPLEEQDYKVVLAQKVSGQAQAIGRCLPLTGRPANPCLDPCSAEIPLPHPGCAGG